MFLLQSNLPVEAGQTIIKQWGVPGAFIVVLAIVIALGVRFIVRRDNRKNEYDKIQKDKDDAKLEKLQDKYDNQIILQTKNTDKIISLADDLKDVVVNNTVAFKEFSSFLSKSNNSG